MPSEAQIEHQILTWLNLSGLGFFWKNVSGGFFDGKKMRRHSSPFAIRGVPDILGVLKDSGRFVALEVKAKTGRVSDHQAAFIAKIQRDSPGAIVAVVRSLEEAQQAVLKPPRTSSESSPAL